MHSLLDTFTALNYTYKPKVFSGRLLLFRANERPEKLNDDRTLGWSDVVRGGVKVHDIPGGHISMMRTPNVSHLAEQLEKYLVGVPASDK
jgi:thioesterase domain-containing protein